MRLRNNVSSGYQESTYKEVFGAKKGILLIGSGPQDVIEFDDNNHPTGTVLNKKIEVYYPSLGTQVVKMPADFSFEKETKDLSEVQLINPEACIIRNNVYVRATAILTK